MSIWLAAAVLCSCLFSFRFFRMGLPGTSWTYNCQF